jgi:hypothetical protein
MRADLRSEAEAPQIKIIKRAGVKQPRLFASEFPRIAFGGNDGLDTSLAFGHGLSRRGVAF